MSELGQVLKEAREQKNLSLDDLQEETKIQRRYLKAIEDGDYSQLPGDFYTRAFIKSYAEAVGLDFKSLVEEYPGDMPKLEHQRVETRVTPPDGSENERSPKKLHTNAVRSKNWSSFVNKAIVIVFVLIALMIVYILVTHIAGGGSNPSTDESSSNSVQYKGDSASPDSSSSSDSASSSSDSSSEQKLKKDKEEGTTTTYTLSGTDQFDVTVTAKSNSPAWFEAVDNTTNKQIAQGTAARTGKKSYHFDASDVQTLRLKFGNVPGTELKINGKNVNFSNSGTVQTLLINFSK
ncbi:helix-turn-helix domain-containing protein [Sporolactobacillus shoreicorticis]|uniref:helix-turn-helix domain-containing protein n=1 Tax=Sporolactobacillus shoreicorticis TaxID=1923877 RepID=UPI0020978061|nr:RodZ domain-containing protein [Sporolactobacillus shoreicorticis]MCO7125937.1 helix-turn-helix domain-containing protein [Sporolactobacillus shoreicorticis]